MAKKTKKTETVTKETAAPVAQSANAEPERTDESKKEIAIERAHGVHAIIEAPAGWNFDRTLTIHGKNHEHVSEDDKGRWVYRKM